MASTTGYMGAPGWGPFKLIPRLPEASVEVHCEGGTLIIVNFVVPFLYHYIKVVPTKGKERIEKVYDGPDGAGGMRKNWSTCVVFSLFSPCSF